MKTTTVQKGQDARAAKTPRIEATRETRPETVSQSQANGIRAYAAAGATMAPIASTAIESPGHATAEYLPAKGKFLDETDLELNRHLHGTSVALEETDDEDDTVTDHEEDVEYSEEEYEDHEDEQAETSASDEGEQSVEPAVPIKDIVRKINLIALDTVERGKREIGEYVFTVVFKRNIDDVLSKNPYKTESMRKISEDPELRINRRRLGNWVRAAALCTDLEANNVDCSKIMTAQLAALLRVKDQGKRRELANEVNSEGLSLRQILQRADELNSNGNSKSAAKFLRRKINDPLSLLADKEAIALLEDQDRLAEEIPYKDRIEMVTVIDEVADRMEMSKDFLEKVRDNLVLIDMQRLQRSTA
jgi:hypothetical protein